jgi:hypothetical protein
LSRRSHLDCRAANHLTPPEEVSRVLHWAEQQGFAGEPAMVALRGGATDHAFQIAITWAQGRGFFNIAAALERALSSTLTVAEFVRRGQAAQQAVDNAILSSERRSKRKS